MYKPLVLTLVACVACGDSLPARPDAAADGADATPDIDAPPDPEGPLMLDLTGSISPVHDPVAIQVESLYFVFSTGNGLPIHVSTDLLDWETNGQVFAQKPDWITTTDGNSPNNLWAPDISYFNGTYHLYYAASSFGSRSSCIGHATTPTLISPVWTDLGAVICSTESDEWNAIDPNAITDEQGQHWLAFGSFWSGLKLIKLDANGAREGTDFYSLATRENEAVEAPFIVFSAGYYYLFESVDFCCRGVASTYKTMVGRSASITGPYVDKDGVALLSGGGTLINEGDARWKGPGHNAILRTAGGDYNLYHSYDAQAGGAPTLRIAELEWGVDGWPISAGP
jgi:arabinan endo-1,5-alpha-L-arabinosidase